MAIKLLITDFDGTLVDTFEANYMAYRQAFRSVGLELSRERYRECFGYRFDKFMDTLCIDDVEVRTKIREAKSEYYPAYFNFLVPNRPLIDFIRAFRLSGGKTAVASTAREKNLLNALNYIGADNDFDLILSGESVSKGKPDPEIYQTVLSKFDIDSSEALVFEDSEVGFKAAENAYIRYITITPKFFSDGI